MTMIEVKTCELSGAALDWAVAQAEGMKSIVLAKDNPEEKWQVQKHDYQGGPWWPSQSWDQCGPLIEKHKVELEVSGSEWCANLEHIGFCFWMPSESPLIAACRAIVAARLGDTVSVPAELVQS